jgi:hypothetical protein
MSTKHTNIVERLRKPTSVRDKDLLEAADIIIGLRVENSSANAAIKRLRAALNGVVEAARLTQGLDRRLTHAIEIARSAPETGKE